MKQFIIFLIIFNTVIISKAQSPYEPGRRIKTLSLDLVVNSDEDAAVSLSHRYLKIVKPNLAIGYELSATVLENYLTEEAMLKGGLLIRYIIPRTETDYYFVDFYPFIGVDVDENFLKGIRATPGYSYFLNRNVAIEPQILLELQSLKAIDSGITYKANKSTIGFQVKLQMYFDRLFDFSKKEFWKPDN